MFFLKVSCWCKDNRPEKLEEHREELEELLENVCINVSDVE